MGSSRCTNRRNYIGVISIYSREAVRGKKIVLAIIMIENIYYLTVFFFNIIPGDGHTLIKQILALLAIAVISFLFYKGFKLGAWFAITLLINPVLTIVFGTLKLIGILELYDGWLMLIILIAIGILGGVLVGMTNSVPAFMEEQRKRRR